MAVEPPHKSVPPPVKREVDPLNLAPRFNEWGARHPSVRYFEPLFEFDHLPADLQAVSAPFAHTANLLLTMCNDGPELSAALRKLLEAKDCAVRQKVLDRGERE